MDSFSNNKQAEFMNLFSPEKDRLEKYCLSITGNRDDAKDLVSETILQTYARFYKIKDKSKFAHYLFRVAKRLHIKRTRTLHRFLRIEKGTFIEKDNTPDATHQLDIRIMYEALSHLPLKLKQAVILHEISGFTMKEVAEIEGCSISAAKARVMRGRNKLSKWLQDREISENFKKEIAYNSSHST